MGRETDEAERHSGWDLERAERVALQIDTGQVAVKMSANAPYDMPFGGTKRSGYGKETRTAVSCSDGGGAAPDSWHSSPSRSPNLTMGTKHRNKPSVWLRAAREDRVALHASERS